MRDIRHQLSRFLKDEDGAAGVEYGILVAAVAAGIIIAAFAIGEDVANAFDFVADTLEAECTSPCGNGGS